MEKILYFISIFLVILVYLSSKSDPGSFLDRILSKINSIGVIYIAIGIYITYKIFSENINEIKRNNTLKIIDRSLLGTIKLINDNYSKCPNFCDSLFYSWQRETLGNKKRKYDIEDSWESVLQISFQIFQAFEDVLTVSNIDQTGFYVWIANFMPWAHSKKLKKAWDTLYPNFADKTIEFGNFMFKVSNENIPRNTSEYKKRAKEIFEMPFIRNLLYK
jgi:hypothetical protein